MTQPDLNLLVALEALLTETSVTGAARRLGLSASAMSRTLTRLRTATGDPLLTSAGRGLVATPRALALREQVGALVHDARAVLRPAPAALDPATLDASFTIRASQSFMETAFAPMVAALRAAAPRIRLRFVPKPDKDMRPLREGAADLEIGVVGERASEVRARLLFRDTFVGVARTGHPLTRAGPVVADRFAACDHVAALPRGGAPEPIDASLATAGLRRNIVVTVPGYPDALRIVRATDLVTVVPRSCLDDGGSASEGAAGLAGFELPVPVPEIAVSMLWHPRLDADPAHRWLREAISAFFGETFGLTRRQQPREQTPPP